MNKLICDNCGATSDNPEDKVLLYWIEKSESEITRCLCPNCKPTIDNNTIPTYEGALEILKLRTRYIGKEV